LKYMLSDISIATPACDKSSDESRNRKNDLKIVKAMWQV
jgi:hypothetical protein